VEAVVALILLVVQEAQPVLGAAALAATTPLELLVL
jgi:hypothetical protein